MVLRRPGAWTSLLVASLNLTAGTALAARRISLVAPLCPPEAITLVVDAAGVEDVCVARGHPVCQAGLELRIDAAGEADACLPAKRPETASAPAKCRAGLRLLVRPGPDTCERAEPPRCPSGFTLRRQRGADACAP